MTLEEIKRKMQEINLSTKDLAEKLGVSPSSLRQVLAGTRPLTDQLSRHIAYVLGSAKEQTFIYSVNLPDGQVKSWVPGWENLTEEERQTAVKGIIEKAIDQLAAIGAQVRNTDDYQALIKKAKQASVLSSSPVLPGHGQALNPLASGI